MAKFKDLKKSLERAQIEALKRVAEYYQNEVDPFVPIAKGDLRKSSRIEETKGKVYLSYGKGTDYAQYQYNERLLHKGERGKYRSIGSNDKVYAKEYRRLKRLGVLTPSKAVWFDAVLKDRKVLKRGGIIYKNALEKIL